MIRVKVSLSMGFDGCHHEDVLEFEDGTTQKEIDEAVNEWGWNYIDLCAHVIEGEPVGDE